jgi:hypothetical protein
MKTKFLPWIRVDQRLPADGHEVQVWTTAEGWHPSARLWNGSWQVWELGGFDTYTWVSINFCVTHWMEKPSKPPE